jgi:transcriptional regulator with XRE-family HTH domain
MTETTRFATLLKRYRQAAGLSQEELAARAQLSTRAISDLERGINRTPRNDTLELVTEALSLSSHQRALLRAAARPEIHASAADISSFLLPVPPTSLVGREQELNRALALIRRDHRRLLTVTGPSGVGKTRLGLQVAEELSDTFSDAVAWVPLESVRDASLVPGSIAHALQLREQGDAPLPAQISSYLQPRHFLLVLDNFEQVLEAAVFVADLLASCPRLTVLVTSRTPLHLRGEQELPLGPLALNDAILLFAERSQALRPGGSYATPLVQAICERVDRLPLAIELVAVHVKVFSLPELLERLTNRLAFLRGGARDLPARQQTMEAAIAWSYELLTETQQPVFVRSVSLWEDGRLRRRRRFAGVSRQSPSVRPA